MYNDKYFKFGTKITVTASPEQLKSSGIDEPYASEVSGATGTIIKHVYGDTYYVRVGNYSWALRLSEFELRCPRRTDEAAR